MPIYLSEISPPAFRAIFTGLTYQLGNAVSSPSTQIINALSESHYITNNVGKRVQAYGPVMGIATAIIAFGTGFTAAFGPEKKGARFEEAAAATTAGAGVQQVEQNVTGTEAATKGLHSTHSDEDEEKKAHGDAEPSVSQLSK